MIYYMYKEFHREIIAVILKRIIRNKNSWIKFSSKNLIEELTKEDPSFEEAVRPQHIRFALEWLKDELEIPRNSYFSSRAYGGKIVHHLKVEDSIVEKAAKLAKKYKLNIY